MTHSKTGTIVVKYGTEALWAQNGAPRRKVLRSHAQDIFNAKNLGYHVLVVSSGAVGTGRGSVSAHDPASSSVREKQKLAAVGQIGLMLSWKSVFKEFGLCAAQVLLTKRNLKNKRERECVQDLVDELLACPNIVPIINENDSVAVDELKYGDNDRLAGQIIKKLVLPDPQHLILVTSAQGVYDRNPNEPGAEFISHLYHEDKDRRFIDTNGKTSGGSGGMGSKLDVAFQMSERGVPTHIVSRDEVGAITRIIGGDRIGTTVHPKGTPRLLIPKGAGLGS